MSAMSPSDLILRDDGSVYHLGLLPDDIALTVLTVGDPARVSRVSRHFDHVRVKKSQREFVCHTGTLRGKELTVLSTGMGSSNIEIVMIELDQLVNVDLSTRKPYEHHTSLNIIRMGTSGSISTDLVCGDLVLSAYAVALDGLHHFYPMAEASQRSLNHPGIWQGGIYAARYTEDLAHELAIDCKRTRTYTAQGFYAPQGRPIRTITDTSIHQLISAESLQHIEMETAAIYHMAEHLGHRACSFSVILAERLHGRFAKDPVSEVDRMIETVLQAAALLP